MYCGWIRGEALDCSALEVAPGVKTYSLRTPWQTSSFQVFPEVSVVDGLVSLTVVVRTVFFRSEDCRVVLDRLRALYPRLILNGIENFIDGEPQQSEVLFHLESLE